MRTAPPARELTGTQSGRNHRGLPVKRQFYRPSAPTGRCEFQTSLGQNRGMEEERASGTSEGRGLHIGRWESLIIGLFVSLVIVGPTFLSEETWHGAPLIDRGGALWVIPAAVMAVGFFVGGAIAGYHKARAQNALLGGLAVSFLTIVLAFLGDLVRRHALGEGLQRVVAEYWLGAVFAAVFVGSLGGLSGRWLGMKMAGRQQFRRDSGPHVGATDVDVTL